MSAANEWTVENLIIQRPGYICFRWMEHKPDLQLLLVIGSVYKIQVQSESPLAADSLRCFYAVHERLVQAHSTEMEVECDEPLSGRKRARGGCGLLLQSKKLHME